MLSKTICCGLKGIDGYIVCVETDISNGIPAFDIVGLADTAVKESRERVRAAIKNSGLEYPLKRITINLAPAHKRKEGTSFDLAIAIGILSAIGRVPGQCLSESLFIGELSLDGTVKPVRGILPIVLCAKEEGIKKVFLPGENANEAAVVNGIEIFPINSLMQLVNHLNSHKNIDPYYIDTNDFDLFNSNFVYSLDFADVKGQANAKRALEVAASGGHNCIMLGSPGCGKTMLAKRLPSILPPLTFEESLEVTKIYSIVGLLKPGQSLVTERPFRAPHHKISDVSLVGGGRIPVPGEVSLANHGVLFLDEFSEFSKTAIEALRQPLEDGIVTVSRINATVTYPSKIMLVCAANPCKCGNHFENERACTCTYREVQQYKSKLSGPLMDRIDIQIEVSSVKYDELEGETKEESSETIKERVHAARKIQLNRYKDIKIFSNASLTPAMVRKYCKLDQTCRNLLKDAFKKLNLSARAHDRILKVSRTIADMEESEVIKPSHIAEAIQYRSLDRQNGGIL